MRGGQLREENRESKEGAGEGGGTEERGMRRGGKSCPMVISESRRLCYSAKKRVPGGHGEFCRQSCHAKIRSDSANICPVAKLEDIRSTPKNWTLI